MNTLLLSKTYRIVRANQTAREYLDFIVSGRSLKTILNIETADYITLFGWGTNLDYERHILNVFRLKEKSELESGRIMIYVCPECGGIDCGAITATIKDFGNKIVWTEFGYETGYGGLSETYDNIKAIEFDRTSYFTAFQGIGR